MVDMNALERQLSDESLRIVGPARPVDDLAVFDVVTAADRQGGWGFTMLSAVKFVAAGLVVALFGGFLLASVLTAPQEDEVLPAAVTDSPSPLTTDEFISSMVTEEVEPGVSRVINDGHRDIAVPVGGWGTNGLAIDDDGHVWIRGEKMAYRVGHPPAAERTVDDRSVVGITSDGTIWATTPGSTIASFDGEAWTERATVDPTASVIGVVATPDGTAWATTVDSSQCPEDSSSPPCRRVLLVRIDETGASTTTGWEGAEPGRLQWHRPLVSPNGDLWLVEAGDPKIVDCSVGAFHRYDGAEWHTIDVPEGLSAAGAGETFDLGADGTLWAATGGSGIGQGCLGPNSGLARLDESGWSLFTWDDGVRTWGGEGAFGNSDHLQVAPDGGVWVAGAGWGGCHGVAHFDGAAWTPYLEGYCVDGLDIADDGTVWALASADSGGLLGLHVITPEAAVVADARVTEPPPVEEASTTAVHLPATVVTEEVEPGVLRLVSDGRLDLSQAMVPGWDIARTVIAPDGSTWMFDSESFFRLGSEGDVHDWPVRRPNDTGFAANGGIWATYPKSIRVFDGTAWTTHSVDVTADRIEPAPDGKVWARGWDTDTDSDVIGWFEPGSFEFVPAREVHSWDADEQPDGAALAQIGLSSGGAWSVRHDGTLELYRWTTGAWEEMPSSPEPGYGVLGVGPDGTVWTARCPDFGCWGPWASRETATLARQVGDEWQESGPTVHLSLIHI